MDQSHRTVLTLNCRRADLDVTLGDEEGRGRMLTEPPFCTFTKGGAKADINVQN
jgi:hypothetical protein